MTLQPAKLKPYLFLLVILLLAFLPVSTLHFGMKNDAFSDNFPNKFFFSEAIHSGFLPLWNPYLNFGFPVYADPGFAFWNPVTWFFGAVVGYNAYTLTIEVLLYIYIAGITMYRLGRYFNFTSAAAIAVASMYMCSGFFTGELQHINFLTSAAFLPFLLHRFLILSDKPGYKNAFLTSIAYFLVFAGGHPAVPIGTVYFLISFSISIVIFNKEIRKNLKVLLKYQFLSLFIFILLFSPAMYSYLSIIHQYARGESLNQLNETMYGFSPTSYLSFLYPFAAVKDASFLTDDLSMRNAFFSVAGFGLVLCQLKNKNYVIRSLFVCSSISLILSSGGYVKAVLYAHLPFMTFIRTNGEFRIFGILCFCIIAGFGLNDLQINTQNIYFRFRKIIRILLLISLSIFFFALIKSISSLPHFSGVDLKTPVSAIKAFIDNLTFYNALCISAAIQCCILLLLFFVKADLKRMTFIIIADLIINSIAYLPFSGVGTVTLAEIQKVYNAGKKGIVVPPLIAIKNIDTFSVRTAGLAGSESFYNKKIGITKLTGYPSYFSNTDTYFKNSLSGAINNLPYVFLKKNIADFINDTNYRDRTLTVDFFSPQKIHFTVNASGQDSLIFLQNYYTFWRASVDGKSTAVNKTFITFMSVPVNKGHHQIEFYYEDKWLFLFIVLSISTFIAVIAYILFVAEIKVVY